MTTRKLWIGTSWKMTKTLAEARAYARALAAADLPPDVQPFVMPAHTSLAAVRDCLPAGCRVMLGAQNAHWEAEGAGTGEISMRMAADAGAVLVELGHSERRERFGETDETVARKVRAAVDHGLTPLVCVGETGPVRAAGDPVRHVSLQVERAFSALRPDEVSGCLVAYEPVWAIGTRGRPASGREIAPVLEAVSLLVDSLTGGAGCAGTLYGGSVHLGNARELLASPHVDGLFVGRAAWDVEGYLSLLDVGHQHLHALRG